MDRIKISIGMIVLNGEPFLKYNLRSLYPFAHEIIVVEGACPSAAEVATYDGRSTDNTIKVLEDFKAQEDSENKITIVTAQDEGSPSGFWPNKDKMSQAYAKRATGNYIWQVDTDEFYHEDQVRKLLNLLEREKPDAISFPQITFWGGLDYQANSFYLIRDNAREVHRLFAWRNKYSYHTHFPTTIIDEKGVDLRKKRWFRASHLQKRGIFLYHYSLLFPLQVYNKVRYYKARNKSNIDCWEESVYRRLEKPYRAHNVYQHLGWIERYKGVHPSAIHSMIEDVKMKKIDVEMRKCQDVEILLSSKRYKISTTILKFLANIMRLQPFNFFYRAYCSIKFRLGKIIGMYQKEISLSS